MTKEGETRSQCAALIEVRHLLQGLVKVSGRLQVDTALLQVRGGGFYSLNLCPWSGESGERFGVHHCLLPLGRSPADDRGSAAVPHFQCQVINFSTQVSFSMMCPGLFLFPV